MNIKDPLSHWENIYSTQGEEDVSWFQDDRSPSLDLIELIGLPNDAHIIDIGGGASRLVDDLIAMDFHQIAVLDISETALNAAKARLGPRGNKISWVTGDVTKWEPSRTYDLWHDRAAFHFLIERFDQCAYVERLKKAVNADGHVVIGTFAPDGPERCSGLPIMRHDAAALAAILGSDFDLIDARQQEHATPRGARQKFQFSTFRRRRAGSVVR